MAKFAKPSTSTEKRKRSSAKSNDLQTSVKSFAVKLYKELLDAKDFEKSLDERKKHAINGLKAVFELDVALHIKELVAFIKKPQPTDVSDDLTQTQKDVQAISESEGSTSSSVSDKMPEKKKARKRSSPKFKTLLSAGRNLTVLLFKILLDLESPTLSDQEKKSIVVNALKLVHKAKIIEHTQQLQRILKELDPPKPNEQPASQHEPFLLSPGTLDEILSSLI